MRENSNHQAIPSDPSLRNSPLVDQRRSHQKLNLNIPGIGVEKEMTGRVISRGNQC
jgi:hypothetical protein